MTCEMLPLGAIRVLVVLAGDPPDAGSTPALEEAVHAALGADAVISIRRAKDESEEALAEDAALDHATLLCVVGWSDGSRRATIRFLRPEEGHWSDREIRFDNADAPSERGRTVGFAVASMVPDQSLARRTNEETPRQPPPALVSRPVEPAAEKPVAERPRPRQTENAIDLAGTGAIGLGGAGGGVGGVLAARLGLSRAWSLRFSAGARVAELSEAQATYRSYLGGGGIAWATTIDREWTLGGRLDALVLGQEVVHLSADDPTPDHQFRFMPGAAAAIEGAWRFANQASVIAALGSEVAFGRTDVFVHNRQVVGIVPVRPLLELGLRVSF